MSKALICGIHLDLKYLISSKAYLNDWVRQLPQLGVNTLLIEYEDKFPYQKYPFLQHCDAFTPGELRQFLTIAREAGLRIIPLVQTLSHLEFALAHPQLAHLREAPHIPTQLDPTNPQAIPFVRDLIQEVLAYHQEDEWFHLGADEAWHLGWNERTKKLVERIGVIGLWSDHVGKMVRWMMQEHGKRSIVFDDTFWPAPDKIADSALPKETILMVWSYGVTDLMVQKKVDEHGGELGTTNGKLRQVDAYHKAGYETIAAPCLNWGTLLPRHDHCLKNTSALAQKVQMSGMMGIINTAWSVFHTLPHAQHLHIAATAVMLKDPKSPLERSWQDDFLTRRYGVKSQGVAEALAVLSEVWEHGVDGLPRPVTPIIYGYMDMVMHFKSLDERRARGSYPLDWNEIDFNAMFGRKVQLLRDDDGKVAVSHKLHELMAEYERCTPIVQEFMNKALNHQQEAAYYAVAVEMKLLHSRVLGHLVLGEGDGAALAETWKAIGPRLKRVLTPLMEEYSREWAMRIWWEPTAVALSA